MKFKEYLDHCNKLAKEYPVCLDYECFYSTDDEGNDYKKVIFDPSIQIEEDSFIDDIPNSVCIN